MTQQQRPPAQGEPSDQGEPTTTKHSTDPSDADGAVTESKTWRTDRVVFGVGAALALVFLLWGVLGTESLTGTSSSMLAGLIRAGGWGFILAATGFVVFALYLAFSKFGKIRLGADDEKPEFRTVSWIAMMFSAGMGIGLMFFGVAEPISFFGSPPPGSAAPGSPEALEVAMATSLFHWTLHPWAIYAVVGLAIAYSTFRRGRRQLISQAFIPLIGEKGANGPIGKAIDILAIFATLFGSAASLGIGALQIGGGLEATGFMDNPGVGLLVIVIVVLTAAFILSAISGIAKGIQWLSNINMVLAGVLALFVFVVGPTVLILDLIPSSLGAYFGQFFEMVGRTEATGGEPMLEWLSSWTVFYWAWWISWTPFVGMFLARISRGRTIRQFVGGVILVPSLVSLVWFSVFGGTAITQMQGGRTFSDNSDTQLFEVLQAYPLATISGILVMVLVGIFFVSGADAASIVMGTLSQRGTDEPRKWVVIFWGSVMGAVAVVMLLVGGEDALDGLQSLTILVAAPFAIIMVMLCVALTRDLNHDPIVLRDFKSSQVMEQAVDYGTDRHGEDFYIRVQAFEPDARPAADEESSATTPTYASVKNGEDPFASGESDEASETDGTSAADDSDGPGSGTHAASRPEPAGRPSADRE